MRAPNYFTPEQWERDVRATGDYATYGDAESVTTAASYATVFIRDAGTWIPCQVYSINKDTWMIVWQGTKRHLMVPKRISRDGTADQLADSLKEHILPSMNPGCDMNYISTAGGTMLAFLLYLHYHADDFYNTADYSCLFYIPTYVNVEPFRLKMIRGESFE